MGSTLITCRSRFECGYVSNDIHNSPRFHWYSYVIEVSLSGNQYLIDTGRIVEFSEFQHILNSALPDRCFLTSTNTQCWTDLDKDFNDIFVKHGMPVSHMDIEIFSAETLVSYFADKLQVEFDQFLPGVVIEEIRLKETPNSFVTWSRSSNK